ncbi:DUF1329 domain-containing protein [Castellaniella defragrans]|uniref:DUF1329 domain-containing protein n=1 Tax=Castellaniella defragrans TaxID=75697 RepID=A0A7W9TN92_CASDE|nr:DUF1329 domain-containing protein [Castellaniella defragrans]KAB0622573.1 DUF1329 domain-containing protein [Castellaniella defragrans]MBB6082978.1 hypothetical protein [Castellaniella defragrans]
MNFKLALAAAAVLGTTLIGAPATAAVSPEEAAKLKTELTPFGAEKAGNQDGSIPAWTGGYTTPQPDFKNGGRRPDPFAGEKPLLSINAQNVDQYADQLTEGVKALIRKYPETYRVDVYPTHRTAAAPQWVYDNTFKNATRAHITGNTLEGAYGGIPFPIPKTGTEVMWNHLLHWRGTSFHVDVRGMQGTGDGKHVPTVFSSSDFQLPYYFEDGSPESFKGVFWMIRMMNYGPPIRAGEAIVGRESINPDNSQTWVYLTGQRRVRKLPNACCDTPTPASAGVSMFDQTGVFNGRLDRFDWKILGKKEMIIPYNTNRALQRSYKDVLLPHHLNPDDVRWEKHRVWVIEATVAQGFRHQSPKRRYYVDEDTWVAVLADHWDANDQLWQMGFSMPIVMPDLPATAPPMVFGFYDLLSGAWYYDSILNDAREQYKIMPRYDDTVFTPEAMSGEGVR